MTYRNRLLAVVAALFPMLFAMACAQSSTPAPPARNAPATSTKEAAQAGGQSKWEKLVSAAKQEGRVVVYGEAGSIFRDQLTRNFKEQYRIQVEMVPGKGPEVAQKYLTEKSANLLLADVLMTGQTTTLTMVKPRGVLTSAKPSLILPEVLDVKAWPHGTLPFLDREEMVLALVAGSTRMVSLNSDQVKEGDIQSYTDLLNPKWKGRITVFDPSMPGNGGTWLAFVMLKAFGRESGEKYLRQLAGQDLAVTRDARLQVETVARGKYAIAIGSSPQVEQDFVQAGAAIGWPKVKEGTTVTPGALVAALPDKPAHPNAAALMLNYLLSKEGQLIASESAGKPASRTDVSTKYALPGTVPQAGDTWVDEDFILAEPTFYPLAKEIFNLR